MADGSSRDEASNVDSGNNPNYKNGLFCWEFIDCPESVRNRCPVYLDKDEECWKYEVTQCSKILGFTCECEDCRYYRAKVYNKATRSANRSQEE